MINKMIKKDKKYTEDDFLILTPSIKSNKIPARLLENLLVE
jgi:hypothetical protein